MSDAHEWLTVPQLAARLNIQERQARRLVNRLPETERSAPGERPAKVRWCPDNFGQCPDTDSEQVGENSEQAAVLPDIDSDRAGSAPNPAAEVSGHTSEAVSGMSEVSEPTVGFLQRQLEEKDRQIAGLQALVVNEQRLRWNDQEEVRTLRSRLAIAEAPTEPEPPRRSWLANTWDKFRGRKP